MSKRCNITAGLFEHGNTFKSDFACFLIHLFCMSFIYSLQYIVVTVLRLVLSIKDCSSHLFTRMVTACTAVEHIFNSVLSHLRKNFVNLSVCRFFKQCLIYRTSVCVFAFINTRLPVGINCSIQSFEGLFSLSFVNCVPFFTAFLVAFFYKAFEFVN